MYPLFGAHPLSKLLSDQYAFRPTGSTTVALVSILNDLSELTQIHPYAHIIALDFSKAFDTLRHQSVMSKLASMPIPDFIFNWIADYLTGRAHSTKVHDTVSPPLPINASIVQGSALGPILFALNSVDLKAVTAGNKIHKYADDTYLIVPASNSSTILMELENVSRWAENNNLKLNCNKSLEMIVSRVKGPSFNEPSALPAIARTKLLNILGVTIDLNLSVSDHVSSIIIGANQNLYALKTLKAHGLPINQLDCVFKSTLVARLIYASQAWIGFANQSEKHRLQSVLNKSQKWKVCSSNQPALADTLVVVDSDLFRKVVGNPSHILHALLPPLKAHNYSLRSRSHNFCLPNNSTAASRNFIHRMLFSNIY